jgi:hypothetical protein
MEELKWKARSASKRSELVESLEKLMKGVVVAQLQEINSKIECLCQMGIISDNDKLQELRSRMKQLQAGASNDSNI